MIAVDEGSVQLAETLTRELASCVNGPRAMSFLSRIAAAFEKENEIFF